MAPQGAWRAPLRQAPQAPPPRLPRLPRARRAALPSARRAGPGAACPCARRTTRQEIRHRPDDRGPASRVRRSVLALPHRAAARAWPSPRTPGSRVAAADRLKRPRAQDAPPSSPPRVLRSGPSRACRANRCTGALDRRRGPFLARAGRPRRGKTALSATRPFPRAFPGAQGAHAPLQADARGPGRPAPVLQAPVLQAPRDGARSTPPGPRARPSRSERRSPDDRALPL